MLSSAKVSELDRDPQSASALHEFDSDRKATSQDTHLGGIWSEFFNRKVTMCPSRGSCSRPKKMALIRPEGKHGDSSP